MPEYATIAVQVTEHGDDLVGVDAELSARPLTDGAMLSYPAEPERLSVGTWKAGPNSDGSINLQIPIDTFQNPPWRFDLRLKGGSQPVNIPLGTYQITGSAALTDLVNIDVTTVSPTVLASVAQYAADAQAAAETVAAIPTTTDGLIADRVNDPTSATVAALMVGFVAQVEGDSRLDALLASLPAWSEGDPLRRVTVTPGVYTRTQAVRVPSGTVLNLHGVTLNLGPNVGDDVIRNADRVAGNEWIWIMGGHLNGNVANQANASSPNGGQSGVSIYNSQHVTVSGVYSRDTFRHGFDASTDTYANLTGAVCKDINFVDCTATGFGDDGFTTHYASSVTFRGCTSFNGTGGLVANGASHGFEIDDGSADVIIINCTSYNNGRGRGFYVKSHASAVFHSRFTLIGCESYGNALEGFGITSEGTGVGKLSDVSLVGCWSHDNVGDGLRITNTANVTVQNFSSYRDDYGVRVVGALGTDGIPMCRDIVVDGFRIIDPAHHGIWMNETSTSRAVRFSHGLIRGANDDGIYAGQPDATFESIIFEGIDVCPVRVKGTAKRIAIRDSEFWDSVTTCINVQEATEDVDVDGCTFQPPAAGNTHGAVEFPSTSTAKRVTVRNSKTVGAWTRGVYVLAGAALTDVAVQANNFKSATSAGVTNSGTVTGEFVVTGNLGYPTERASSATIADGQASATVSHGLCGAVGRIPTSIQLGKRTAEDVWVGARTTSTFTVTRTGTSGALTFDWRAQYQH